MSLSLASRILAICCARIKGTTMRGELICPYTKTRRSRVLSRPAAKSSSRPFWVDCTINMGGFEFPIGTPRLSVIMGVEPRKQSSRPVKIAERDTFRSLALQDIN